ncbi:MAG: ADP-ribosylglycohydrolase family protein [Bacteroidales bacterium]|nr:ADP-ribosylglycohydrolase family protein [Bacteroidales bacterium]
MKRLLSIFAVILLASCARQALPYGQTVQMGEDEMMDRIRGGWFAQTIGCTYGGPTEFKFKGGLLQDAQPIFWSDDYIRETFVEDPGLYDDVYMDLTFLEVMAELGIDAPVSEFADRFANAPYKLWHANQAARYNILNGRPAPESGHWMFNPHADDIDFQIEADFIGMLTPGRPNDAAAIADRIGHIMNYGDGWYGGVYVSALYSLAYVCDDIPALVREALLTIPEGTKFRNCIEDVIRFHAKYPNDWKQCWFEVDKRHSFDVGCPEGVWNGFNIDAVINAAYVVIGLLYGEGDFEKTMEISTRCGQDSDCNPASAAGILGVMYGYKAIPEKYRRGADVIADLPFPYTTLSLNTACSENLRLMKETSGCNAEDGNLIFTVEKPEPVRYEQSFEGIRPVDKIVLKKRFTDELTLRFRGNSIVVEGSVVQTGHDNSDYRARLQAWLDGQMVEEFVMPYDYITRKYEVFSRYCFGSGEHTLTLKLLNPHPDYVINAQEMVIYDEDK